MTHVSVITCAVTWIWGCDPSAESKASANRTTANMATTEHMADTTQDAKARSGALWEEVRRNVELAIVQGADASARRARIQNKLQRLSESQPAPDLSADKDCERFHYLCNRMDVPREIQTRSSELAVEVSTRMHQGAEVDEVLDWLLQQKDVSYVSTGSAKILFRINGGMTTDVDYHYRDVVKMDPFPKSAPLYNDPWRNERGQGGSL